MKPSRREELKLRKCGYRLVAGADEAGRGAWAGPLVAAAVILPERIRLPKLNDSKLVTPRERERLYGIITALAVAWKAVIISRNEIDDRGIAWANQHALIAAIEGLVPVPGYALVDGFRIAVPTIPSERVIHGDGLVTCIAAASIIAKVTRDRLMVKLHEQYPSYRFDVHKGYGTSFHREQLEALGCCPEHRVSYEPMKTLEGKSEILNPKSETSTNDRNSNDQKLP